jgi:hypothetical protein
MTMRYLSAAILAIGASIGPTAVYGLFHPESLAYHVTRFFFSLG